MNLDPDDYDDFDYPYTWSTVQASVTEAVTLGTLYVVTDNGETEWTLLDREPFPFGFAPGDT